MTTEVDAVSLKLPTFWTSTPTTWFAQAEAQFIVRNITNDDTKYYYVVAALDSSTANRAKSLLVAPPTNNKYDAIKKFLTSAYELSNYERATALFNLAGLGDSKPSELMDTMLGLMGDNKPCILFHHLFLQQLPTYVRSQLAHRDFTDLRQLSLEADNIYLAGKATGQHVTFHDLIVALYGIIAAYSSNSDTKKIEEMQLKALRHIYQDYTASYTILREKCNRPMLIIERQKAILLEVYKIIHKIGPKIYKACSL